MPGKMTANLSSSCSPFKFGVGIEAHRQSTSFKLNLVSKKSKNNKLLLKIKFYMTIQQ